MRAPGDREAGTARAASRRERNSGTGTASMRELQTIRSVHGGHRHRRTHRRKNLQTTPATRTPRAPLPRAQRALTVHGSPMMVCNKPTVLDAPRLHRWLCFQREQAASWRPQAATESSDPASFAMIADEGKSKPCQASQSWSVLHSKPVMPHQPLRSRLGSPIRRGTGAMVAALPEG